MVGLLYNITSSMASEAATLSALDGLPTSTQDYFDRYDQAISNAVSGAMYVPHKFHSRSRSAVCIFASLRACEQHPNQVAPANVIYEAYMTHA
jgi:hypothetical protein